MNPITNTEDVIDSRDVIARIEELDSQWREHVEEETTGEWSDVERDELTALANLAAEGEGLDDWDHGAMLVRETYFTDYIRDLVTETSHETVGKLPPYVSIDWETTARTLQTDYTSVEFDGVTYYAR